MAQAILLILLVISVLLILRWMNGRKLRFIGGGTKSDNFAAVLLEDLPEQLHGQFIDMFTEQNTAGLGKRWNKEKAAALFKYAKEDAATEEKRGKSRENWHFALVDNGTVVGYIAVTPTGLEQYPGRQLTWMVPVNHRGHGYTARGLKKIKRRGMGRVYSFVALGNDQSNAVAKKTCTLIGQDTIFGSIHNIYMYKNK